MEYSIKKLVTLTISLLLSGHVLLFYALPFKIFVLVFIALTIFFLFIEWQNAIMVTVSLVLATLVFGIFLKISGINESIYYRPHERFSHFYTEMKHGIYEKNVHFEMKIPHGDLKALALHEEVIPEPREVIFRTDSLGFRNSQDYHGQKYLLVGDSFIVGNGITQNEIITEQLLKEYQLDTYNLSYPGDIKDYTNYVKTFERIFGNEYQVILFLFEGNDFPKFKETKPLFASSDIYVKLKTYSKLFNQTDIYRFMYSRILRYSLKNEKTEKVVDNKMVNGKSVAFLNLYITVSERDFLLDNPDIEKYIKSMKNNIAHIFFIPTKYRVYFKHITESNPVRVLPNRQLELVQQIGNKYDIGITDLTPALIEESDKLLQDGRFTFWKDDSHWNKNGISVAAKIVAKTMLERNE